MKIKKYWTSIFVNKHKFLEKKLKNSPNSVEIKRINLCTLSLRVDIAGWLSSQVGADCLAIPILPGTTCLYRPGSTLLL